MSTKYEAMGMAALLPGMQYMLEKMQAQLDYMREALAAVQNGDAPVKRGVGRPRKDKNVPAQSFRGGWSDDPEERKREMARRQAVRRAKGTPRVKLSRSLAKGAKNGWAKLDPAARQARIDKMLASRRANGVAA